MSIKEISDDLNDHFELYGKDAVDADYDSIGLCPFCNSRIDEFYFCACGNMGADLILSITHVEQNIIIIFPSHFNFKKFELTLDCLKELYLLGREPVKY